MFNFYSINVGQVISLLQILHEFFVIAQKYVMRYVNSFMYKYNNKKIISKLNKKISLFHRYEYSNEAKLKHRAIKGAASSCKAGKLIRFNFIFTPLKAC